MTDEETIKEIQKLKKEGKSISFIARTLGLSRPTTKKYLREQNSEAVHDRRPFSIPQRKIIPIDRPSEMLKKEREVTEIAGLRVEQAENKKALKEIEGPAEHPLVTQRKAEVELVELTARQFEAEARLDDLKEKRLTRERAQEEQRKAIEREEKIKVTIQEVKERVLPFKMRVALPSDIIFMIYQKIEAELLKFDLLSLSWPEIILIADAVLTESINDPQLKPIIQDSLNTFLFREAKRQLNITMKKNHEDYIKKGGILDYRNFILSLVNRYPPEEQGRILEVINV